MRLALSLQRLPSPEIIKAILERAGRHERLVVTAASRGLAALLFLGLLALAPRPVAVSLLDQSDAPLAVVAITIETPPAQDAVSASRASLPARAHNARSQSSGLELWIDAAGSRRFETYSAYRAYRRCLEDADQTRNHDEDACYTRP